MTPANLATLYASAFPYSRAWSEAEFATLLSDENTYLISETNGFALWRVADGEVELLTIAVAPNARRQGIADRLMTRSLAQAARKAETAFLEVAEDNRAALRLYQRHAFTQVGHRPAYYARTSGPAVAALILQRMLCNQDTPDLP